MVWTWEYLSNITAMCFVSKLHQSSLFIIIIIALKIALLLVFVHELFINYNIIIHCSYLVM